MLGLSPAPKKHGPSPAIALSFLFLDTGNTTVGYRQGRGRGQPLFPDQLSA